MNTTAHSFARILGRAPCLKPGEACISGELEAVVEAFGPPETKKQGGSTMLFWSFQRPNGALGFSLWVEVPKTRKARRRRLDLEVSVARKRDFDPFLDFAMDRVGAVSNGDEAPGFLNGARFAIVPA